jgi:lipocalin
MEIKEFNYWVIYKESEYSDCIKALPFENFFLSTRRSLWQN